MPPNLPTTPAPAAPNLNAIPGESVSQYEARLGSQGNTGAGSNGSGAGFGTPVTPQPVTDINSAQQEVAKQLGFNSYQDAISKLSAPTQDTQDFYKNAYSAAGLDQIQSQINSRNSDLNAALGKINDNPWLDEGSRVGRSQTLQTLAQGDIKNLTDEYNEKLQSVHDLVSNHDADLAANNAASQAKLTLLENNAKDLAAQAAAQQKDSETAPSTITAPNGAVYQWNPTTKSFTQLFAGTSSADFSDLSATLSDYGGQKYITPTDLTGYDTKTKDQLISAAKSAGIPTLSPKDSDSLNSIQAAKNNLDAFSQFIAPSSEGGTGVLPSIGGILGLGAHPEQWANVKLNDFFQQNPQLGSFNSWQAQIVPLITALKGSGSGGGGASRMFGTISALLPEETDTLQTAQAKIKNIQTILDNGAQSIIGTGPQSQSQPSASTYKGISLPGSPTTSGSTYNGITLPF